MLKIESTVNKTLSIKLHIQKNPEGWIGRIGHTHTDPHTSEIP